MLFHYSFAIKYELSTFLSAILCAPHTPHLMRNMAK